jgi:hypothetical protein
LERRDPKIKIEVESEDVDSLCSRLYTELQRYGVLKQFIKYSIGFMDADSLKDVERTILRRREEFEMWLRAWDKESVRKYLKNLSPDAKKVLNAIVERGKVTKTELIKVTGFQPMKVAGVIAGMNNMAKKMGYRPVILRESIRLESGRDIEYRVEDSFLENMK